MTHVVSSLAELRTLFERSIVARDIAEPFSSFDSDHPANQVREFMERRDYDVVGVRQDGVVIGYAEKSALTSGPVGDHVTEPDPTALVAETEPLVEVVEHLRESPWLLVTVLGEIGGIITRGDLQKTPVRMWLFGLVSLFEMQLLRLVRERYPDNSWKPLLTTERLTTAEAQLDRRRRRNEALDLADCLQFADKKRIVARTDDLRSALGRRSRNEAEEVIGKLESLRDTLAHSQDLLGAEWPALADQARLAEDLLARCEGVRVEQVD